MDYTVLYDQSAASLVENLARYLVNERRRVDSLLNEQCDPYPTWDEASARLQDSARQAAWGILIGQVS